EMTEYLDQVVDPELDVIERWRDRLESALASAPTSAPVGVDAKARRLYEMIFDAIAEDGSQQAEDACIREIASALAQQPAAPSGEAVSDWVLVPRKPTQAMANAAWRDLESQGIDPEDVETPQVWDAMLDAAPQQSAAVDEAAAIRAFEEHFQASAEDPYFE